MSRCSRRSTGRSLARKTKSRYWVGGTFLTSGAFLGASFVTSWASEETRRQGDKETEEDGREPAVFCPLSSVPLSPCLLVSLSGLQGEHHARTSWMALEPASAMRMGRPTFDMFCLVESMPRALTTVAMK